MTVKLITPATEEPVTLEEAKSFLKMPLDQIDEDGMISSFITSARIHAETVTRRAFITQTFKAVLDHFPYDCAPIYLEKSPVSSIVSIRYMDMNGAWQTMPSNDYIADLSSEPARITPIFGKNWPIPIPQLASVEVLFVSGYGARQAVPSGIKDWIKVRVNSMHSNREEAIITSGGTLNAVNFIDHMLDPYTVNF